MFRLRQALPATLAFFVLFLGSSAVAKADTITFSFRTLGSLAILSTGPGTFQFSAFSSISIWEPVPPFGPTVYRHVTTGSIQNVPGFGEAYAGSGNFTFNFGTGSTITGTLVENLATASSSADIFAYQQIFTITGGTGIFSGVVGSAFASGTFDNFSDHFSVEGSGMFTTAAATSVPEPATMLLLSTGLAGLAARVRKRRKSQTEM